MVPGVATLITRLTPLPVWHWLKAVLVTPVLFRSGRRRWMETLGVALDDALGRAEELAAGQAPIYLAADGRLIAILAVSDPIKPGSREAIARLRSLGISVTMLSGDGQRTAEAVARQIGIERVLAEVLPADKAAEIKRLQSSGRRVGFVGDGINDAPVLMRADIGIAMGALGSDAAIEAADVVLMDDKPAKVAEAIHIAERTMRIVRENIGFALAVKAAVLVLGALGIANMWVAVFADVGVTVLAVLNAMRALRAE